MNHTYTEIQTFRQWYAIFLFAILFALGCWIFFAGFFQIYIQSHTIEIEALVISILIFGVLFFIYSIRLVIYLNDAGISINFFPVIKEFHQWDQIEKVSLAEYPSAFIGVRWSDTFGVVYIIRGRRGVHINFKNGEKVFVSSVNPEKLLEEIRHRLSK